MYDEVLTLIKETYATNEYGDAAEIVESKREVFAHVKSVSRSEKYQALANGIDVERVFVLADFLDYENEIIIEYEGQRYSVIRTYQPESSTKLEMVVKRYGSAE